MATDQASKLGLGKNQSIVCMYSNYQVSMNAIYLFLFVGILRKKNNSMNPLPSSYILR